MSEPTDQKSSGYTYKDSGVDINKASSMLSGLKNIIEATHDRNVLSDLASFCGLFRLNTSEYSDPVLTSSTDGVGTKLILAKQTGNYSGIGQDLVAMSINDLICCGAKPLFFLDYIACGHIESVKISTIIESVADACKYCSTALIGGETAEMPDMYMGDDVDLAGFAVGIVDRNKILKPGLVEKGDLVMGLLSSGLHSNGFSLVRKIIEAEGLDINKPLGWTGGRSLGDVLLTPTKLYSPLISQILGNDRIEIKGIANITGGGFYDNIDRIIPDNMDAVIHKGRWDIPAVFESLKEMGNISEEEMFHVFNMGIGMAVIISPESREEFMSFTQKISEDIILLGEVAAGTGKVQIK
ncbi:MAG TPA: phosphoribosylformylglycinamidine cyclo-ligase [Actinobacteria bacterium]|nr:phosphoribosylformylglycinamidine cyclo-ligase [Actinomycetota bacterium]